MIEKGWKHSRWSSAKHVTGLRRSCDRGAKWRPPGCSHAWTARNDSVLSSTGSFSARPLLRGYGEARKTSFRSRFDDRARHRNNAEPRRSNGPAGAQIFKILTSSGQPPSERRWVKRRDPPILIFRHHAGQNSAYDMLAIIARAEPVRTDRKNCFDFTYSFQLLSADFVLERFFIMSSIFILI